MMNRIAKPKCLLAAAVVIAALLETPLAVAQVPLDDTQRPKSLFDFDFNDRQALQTANTRAVWIVRDTLIQTAIARRCAKLDALELAGLAEIEKSIGPILLKARGHDPILRQGVIDLTITSVARGKVPIVIYAAKAPTVPARQPIVAGLQGGPEFLLAASRAVSEAICKRLQPEAQKAFTSELEQREEARITATTEYLLTAIARLHYLTPDDQHALRTGLRRWSTKHHYPVTLLTFDSTLPRLPAELFADLSTPDVFEKLAPFMMDSIGGVEEDMIWFPHASATLHLDTKPLPPQDSGDAK